MRLSSFTVFSSLFVLSACSAGEPGVDGPDGAGAGSGAGNGSGSGGGLSIGGADGSGGGSVVDEPETCADAAASRSYVGCDFWPTVTANPVWQEFEYAVVVANGTDTESVLTITGPNAFSAEETVPPGELRTIYLPWVSELKGPEYNVPLTTTGRLATSQSMEKGAYHLVASVPISAWQFSPLHYRKDIAECGPRIQAAVPSSATECRAASNDASLLLPSTAMTGNYRVGGYSGARGDENWGSVPGAVAITATADGTSVDMQMPEGCDARYLDTSNGCVVGGGLVPDAEPEDILHFDLNAGDVVQVLGAYGPYPQIGHGDISGALINANKPVQVIAFNAIANIPDETSNADHVEETVLPAEVLGNEYIVAPPTAYGGQAVGHIVRIYGNVDGTALTYPDGRPEGAPDVINAGEVVELPPRAANNQCASGASPCYLTEPFVVRGDQPFAVGSFQLGGKLQAPAWPEEYAQPGDPASSMMVTPEQFRKNYTFLAPADFMENYADILVPEGAEVLLDGAPPSEAPIAIGASGWSILRAKLNPATGGIHSLTTSHEKGLGLQVVGFGNATSFYYPGGLNLKQISVPPVIIVK